MVVMFRVVGTTQTQEEVNGVSETNLLIQVYHLLFHYVFILKTHHLNKFFLSLCKHH